MAIELILSASDQVRPELAFVRHQLLKLAIAVLKPRSQLLNPFGNRFPDFASVLPKCDFKWHRLISRNDQAQRLARAAPSVEVDDMVKPVTRKLNSNSANSLQHSGYV